jgi:hypothetical protein
MNHLLPCPTCSRHVRTSERSCPFCSFPVDFSNVPLPVLVTGRFSRAALVALTASLGPLVLVDCGDSASHNEYGAPVYLPDSGLDDASDAAPD